MRGDVLSASLRIANRRVRLSSGMFGSPLSVPERGHQSSRGSPPNEAAPPGARRLDIEPHLLLKRLQVELHEIGKTALQHEIRHAAGELRGLVRIATKADCDFANTPVDHNPLISLGEHISELIAKPPVADAEII